MAVKEMRPHLAWYLKGVPHSAEIRRQLNTAESMEEVRESLSNLFPKMTLGSLAIVPTAPICYECVQNVHAACARVVVRWISIGRG